MKARIVTIGDEILIGQIIDTNSAWLSSQLNAMGIRVHSIYSIADTQEAIHKALDESVGQVDLVLMTGGLGPTKDDITKGALANWFNSGWKVDEDVLARVKHHFSSRGIPMPAVNLDQAKVPEVCEILNNQHGSAPGMWFEKENTVFISMPGVPYEMKSIFSDEAMPRIQDRLASSKIVHKTIMTQGIGESSLMEIISNWEESLNEFDLKLAYLPSYGLVRLRISGYETTNAAIDQIMQQKVDELLPLISDFVYGFDDEKLEEVVGRILARCDQSIATAESCTGGYLAHMITSVSGSSAYYKGSALTYANDAKVNVLNVKGGTIDKLGAVSEEVAIQMADGARKLLQTDFAVSTTGVAGPNGGTDEKPVGTVWIGIASPSRTYALKFMMGNHRERNIRRTALQALQLVRKEVMRENKLSLNDVLFRENY
jgi:nicotinamide-nucleotide amidase